MKIAQDGGAKTGLLSHEVASARVSQRERTITYIHRQVEHHKKVSFAEECKKFLAIHGLKEEEFSRP